MYYSIMTTEADLEAGYPEYSDEARTEDGLIDIARQAAHYGIPATALTVTKCWDDEGAEDGPQHDVLGSLDEVLRGLTNET